MKNDLINLVEQHGGRFDFHNKVFILTYEQLSKLLDQKNEKILSHLPVER